MGWIVKRYFLNLCYPDRLGTNFRTCLRSQNFQDPPSRMALPQVFRRSFFIQLFRLRLEQSVDRSVSCQTYVIPE
ncbi:hypothetical protein E2N90_05975 [Pseudomonas syringae pv. tomato]|nr:hypothetical protein [Pseudomonas syringae pv. tomato]PYD04162.1 hypothetical protein DND90_06970 [Pseudomonas syringae pv. maculicola]QBI64869.1 hypothetical protein EIZ61_27230 [Pseudomonas syringae]TES58355.1 hypothetical protein E2N91_14535 [Pseudomonas syringae pv. tomato]TES68844.1 hypothetical protein E2N90_05975 [Pseudomonas syringae pv. tomato]